MNLADIASKQMCGSLLRLAGHQRPAQLLRLCLGALTCMSLMVQAAGHLANQGASEFEARQAANRGIWRQLVRPELDVA